MLLMVVSMAERDTPVSEISDATGLDATAIERHFVKCCALAANTGEKDSLAQSDIRLRELSSRISLAANIAGVQGDTKSHLSALSLQLRCELEQRQAMIDRDAVKANNDENTLTIANLDEQVRNFLAVRSENFCYVCNRPMPKEPEQNEVVIAN